MKARERKRLSQIIAFTEQATNFLIEELSKDRASVLEKVNNLQNTINIPKETHGITDEELLSRSNSNAFAPNLDN